MRRPSSTLQYPGTKRVSVYQARLQPCPFSAVDMFDGTLKARQSCYQGVNLGVLLSLHIIAAVAQGAYEAL